TVAVVAANGSGHSHGQSSGTPPTHPAGDSAARSRFLVKPSGFGSALPGGHEGRVDSWADRFPISRRLFPTGLSVKTLEDRFAEASSPDRVELHVNLRGSAASTLFRRLWQSGPFEGMGIAMAPCH